MWGWIYPHVVLLILATTVLQASCKGTSSLTFVIDDTGSMSDDIYQVKVSANKIMNIVFNEKSSLIDNMVLVTFNDPDAQVRVITDDRDNFTRALDAIYAHNIDNPDCWEPSMSGLLLALERSHPGSFIYVFTDAPARDYRDGKYVIEMCQKKQTQIVFILTGRCFNYYEPEAFNVYYDIAAACSGLPFFVEKASVDQVLHTIEETIRGNKTVMVATTVPPGVYTDIPFKVDDQTEYAIVSASGSGVYLEIKGPYHKIHRIMWTDEGKVIKLSDVTAGNFVARVMGHTATSVVIVGRTDFLFSHGFSELVPKTLSDTSPQPFANTKVYLSISVTDPHHIVKIESAQISYIVIHRFEIETVRKVLPLREISKDFYVTEHFVAPSQVFRVAVKGTIKNTGEPIIRNIKIPIRPPLPPKKLPSNKHPTVRIQEGQALTTEYNSSLKLTCKVTAYPAPKITWINNKGNTMRSLSSLLQEPYEYISYLELANTLESDQYTCYVVNEIGKNSTTINVYVKDALAVGSVPSGTTKILYGSEGTLSCDIRSTVPMKIYWYYTDKTTGANTQTVTSDKFWISKDHTQMKIKRMDSDLVGKYTCKATLTNKKDVQKTFSTHVVVDGLSGPKITSEYSKVFKGKDGDAFFRIPCVVTGIPKPTVTWKIYNRTITPSAKYSIEEGALIVRDLNVNDTNQYTCIATNEVGSISVGLLLHISQIPKISGVATKTVKLGSPTSIECMIVKGKPKPKITWEFTDDSGKTVVLKGTINQVVNIARVELKHAGRYKCVAKNEEGSDEHVTTLIVQDMPKINSGKSINLHATEGEALLRIPCIGVGVPKPTITWSLLNGRVITPGPKYTIEDGALIIKNPNIYDTNFYICEAKNDVGAARVTFTAYIRQVPQLSGFATKTVKTGMPASIECLFVKGKPKPNITWEFAAKVGSKFSPIAGSDNVLRISSTEDKHAGLYKCLAQNEVGKDEHVTTLLVESLPKIVSNSSVIEGLEEDVALRIPCDVIGTPQPVITWKLNDDIITPNSKYSIEEGALVIRNPNKKDSLMYTCEAKNKVGTVSATFKVKVEEYLGSYGTKHYVYILNGEDRKLKCDAYNSKSQSITWFKQGEKIKTDQPYIQIVNASTNYDSNYTCRVSDNHGRTQTHTYVVDVGYPPTLYRPTATSDWRGDINDITSNCYSKAKPMADIEWRFNGEVLTVRNVSELGIFYKWGHYTCNVSNPHGSELRSFDVKSSACLISRNLRDVQYTPLILTEDRTWPDWETTEHYLTIEPEEKITFYCPSHKGMTNTFREFPKQSEIKAVCYHQDMFIVDGKSYKLSDLQCSAGIEPAVVRTKEKCLSETSELIRVGYNIAGFLETYEVCFDHSINMPLYTLEVMTQIGDSLNTPHNWASYPGIGEGKPEKGFTCRNRMSKCCYGKSQLVFAEDFRSEPAKNSTFIDPLNSVPSWRPCNTTKTSWEDIDGWIRNEVVNYGELIIWSGTHTMQMKNGAVVPRFLWKVVKFNDEDEIAIVYVNDPEPTDKDIKCDNACSEESWFKANDKFTYCCSLQDFRKAFDMEGADIGDS